MARIPVVDFSKADSLKPGTSSWLSARKDVCRALEDLGCFMATILPSKVPPGLHKTIFDAFDEHFWPTENDQFCESVDLYAEVMAEIDEVVTRILFESCGVEKYHDNHFRLTFHNLRLIKYKVPEKLGGDVGLRSHTDKTFLSIAGDAFKVWSNGRIRSCKHRVTLRENEVRYSLGLFSFQEGVIQIPNELIDKDHPIQYKPVHLLYKFM
ncbi:PREDICTED: LOW QUALITY PROTEIN: 2-oxoglutarate-dependent dioxygenase AOP3-like [Prunus mume]|uniref:LOW QUALITY PROTEIN: 2-oxoglutarate-dependent dioxygenase AOP3-like n=1 Tax=Prunus mume TaxID=102107 RepID=A0ABM1LUF4_PRUMU|nr:PREDICTED: LOW QUALITY PROTEIN: 2-oxoglutarate-dependent dioxygenase AOP3-like [Prunus mume]